MQIKKESKLNIFVWAVSFTPEHIANVTDLGVHRLKNLESLPFHSRSLIYPILGKFQTNKHINNKHRDICNKIKKI